MKGQLAILLIIFSFCCFRLTAQYDAQLSNYWAAPGYYNPAYAGQSGKLELMALNRQQWLGFENSPRTMIVSAEMPLRFLDRVHGVGITFVSESLGLFKHSIIGGKYAYKKKLWNGDFSAGIQISQINEDFLYDKVDIPGEGDDEEGGSDNTEADPGIPSSKVKASTIDFNIGLYYSKADKWYVGLSVTHLLEPELETDGDNYLLMHLPMGFYLMGGYNIKLNNPLLELRPSVFVKSTTQFTQVDVNARLLYKQMFWAGLGWRHNDAAILNLGLQIKNIQVGYAYDFPISAISKATTGSHELFLKYMVDMNLKKNNKNRYKSVRIL